MWGDPHMDSVWQGFDERKWCFAPASLGLTFHRTSLNASFPQKAIHHMGASVMPGRVGPLAQHAAACIAAGVLGSAPTI